MPRIPLSDPGRENTAIRGELIETFTRVLDSGRYVLSEEVTNFENALAAKWNVKHAITVSSGTSALHLALLAIGVGPEDEVITTPLTYPATVAAICHAGATPVLVDVSPETLCLDPEATKRAITPATKAIIPVHLYGWPADMKSFLGLAEQYGVDVIEDAAQSHEAEACGKNAGTLGRAGCFSFYPTKSMGALGEGGAVVTNDDDVATSVRSLRDFGRTESGDFDAIGYNYRLDSLQSAFLSLKLQSLSQAVSSRRALCEFYDNAIGHFNDFVRRPRPGERAAPYIYPFFTRRREALAEHLLASGIETGVHYARPVHLCAGYSVLGKKLGDFPVSEAAARTELSLPLFADLSSAEIEAVCAAVTGFFEGREA